MTEDSDDPFAVPDISLSARTPFGVTGLDRRFGGIPAGTTVLLSGHPDAGIREYTLMSLYGIMQARHDPEGFRRRTGIDPAQYGDLPETVRYMQFRAGSAAFERGARRVIGEDAADLLLDHTVLQDFSERFLSCTQLPNAISERLLSTLEEFDPDVHEEFDFHNYGPAALLGDVVESMLESGPEEVLVVDSLTALVALEEVGVPTEHILGLVLALTFHSSTKRHFSYLLDFRTDEEIEDVLLPLPTGRLFFTYDSTDIDIRQYLRVGTFHGMLGADEQVRFRTRVTESGFEVKDTRTIVARDRRY